MREEKQEGMNKPNEETMQDIEELETQKRDVKEQIRAAEGKEKKERKQEYIKELLKESERVEDGNYLINYAEMYYGAYLTPGRRAPMSLITSYLSNLDKDSLGVKRRYIDIMGIREPGPDEEKVEGFGDREDIRIYQEFILGVAVSDRVLKYLKEDISTKEEAERNRGKMQKAGLGLMSYWDLVTVLAGVRDIKEVKERDVQGLKILEGKLNFTGIKTERLEDINELVERMMVYEELRDNPEEVEEEKVESEIEKNLREVEDNIEIPRVVAVDVTRLIRLIDNTYASVSKGEFAGVLTREGNRVKMYDKNYQERLTQYNEFIKAVFTAYERMVLEGVDGEIGDIKSAAQVTGGKFNRYSPGWHLKNLEIDSNGVTEWARGIKQSFKKYCEAEFLKVYNTHKDIDIEKYKEFVAEMTLRFTNVILMRQVNLNTMLFRVMGIPSGPQDNPNLYADRFGHMVEEELRKYMANTEDVKVGASNRGRDGVTYFSLIYDVSHFTDEMLFGYKRIENLDIFVPDVNNVVLGVGLDGEPVTVNLEDKAGKITQILAGSRSGKGVMTMSLMSTIQAVGGSIVYMDYKPDIGAMLWGLEDRIKKEEGIDVRFLALDAMKDKSDFDGKTPVRYNPDSYNIGVPALFKRDLPNRDSWKVIRLMKLLILTDLLGTYQAENPGAKTGNIFLVIDEIKLMSKTLEMTEKYIRKNVTKAQIEEEPEVEEYKRRLQAILSDTETVITQGIEANWASLGIRVILIGQSHDTKWGESSIVSGLLGNVSRTIAGREQVTRMNVNMTEAQYEMIGAGADTNKGRGMFIVSDSKINPPQRIGNMTAAGIPTFRDDTIIQSPKFFKSYFTIIDNDLDIERYEKAKESGDLSSYWAGTLTNYTTELLKNLGDPTEPKYMKAEADLYNSKTKELNKYVSYKGLLDIVVDKAQLDRESFYRDLNNGYDRYAEMFETIKPYLPYEYNSVEEYICDLRVGSLQNKTELEQMIKGQYEIPKEKQGEEVEVEGFKAEYGTTQADEKIDFSEYTGDDVWSEMEAEEGQDTDDQGYEEEEYRDDQGYDTGGYEDVGYDDGGSDDGGSDDVGYNDVGGYEDTGGYDTQDYEAPREEPREEPREAPREARVKEERKYEPEQRRADRDKIGGRIAIADIDNPYKIYKGKGAIAAVNQKVDISKILLDDLEGRMGGLHNVAEFRINGDKSITVNGTTRYEPSFDLDFLKTVPEYEREQVRLGNVGGLIYFPQVVKRMPNITVIEVEPRELGHSSIPSEMGYIDITGYRKLYRKLGRLQTIVICGEEIGEESEGLGIGAGIASRLSQAFKFGGADKKGSEGHNPLGRNVMDAVINSTPARVMGSAFGWTMGVKATIWMATALGPFGLLFGALAMSGAYQEKKRNR